MILVNIISALGNNSSIYPLLVRDCGIENVAKVAMTYNQNAKDSKYIAKQATRERIIDEYGTSAVWLGGIPLMNSISDKFIKKSGLAPDVNIKLFKETAAQGIDVNIEKFKDLAPKEVAELVKIKNNKKAFQNAQVLKLFATTAIPIAVMGFVLPKLNYKYTAKKIKEAKQNNKQLQGFNEKKQNPKPCSTFNSFNVPSFKGLSALANLSTLQKMMILDGGLAVGRVKTSRNKDEAAEMAFKMGGMCYLNYVAPTQIDKGLSALTKKIFGINTDLDPKILNSKEFVNAVKSKTLDLPQNITEQALLDFVDTKPKTMFTKLARNKNIVSFLGSGIRDPRKYVDTKKLQELKLALETFAGDALKFGDVEKYAKKALNAKSFNIVTNILLSSALLALALPKAQFLFRKVLTGKNTEPGINI